MDTAIRACDCDTSFCFCRTETHISSNVKFLHLLLGLVLGRGARLQLEGVYALRALLLLHVLRQQVVDHAVALDGRLIVIKAYHISNRNYSIKICIEILCPGTHR